MNITKTSLILLQMILLLFLNQCSSQSDYPKDMDYLNVVIEQKKFDKALQICNDFISEDPENMLAYYYRARVYSEMGQIENMLKDSEHAMKLAESKLDVDPDDAGALFIKGSLLLINNELEAAKEYLTKSIETSPFPSTAYSLRANIYASEGQYDKALSDLNQSIASDKSKIRSAKSYFSRGLIYRQLGEIDKAMEDFSTAIRLNPNYADPYFVRSEILMRQGKLKEAKRDVDRGFKLVPNPTDWRPYMFSGEIAHSESKYEKAIGDFTKALEIEPDSALLHILRGDAFIQLHEFESAYNDYKMAVTLEPDNSSAHACYAFAIWVYTHDIHEAIKRFDIALELDPNNEYALIFRQKAVDHLASMEGE